MSRYSRYSNVSYSIGPGPWSFAVKWLIIANVAAFVLTSAWQEVVLQLGLSPRAVFGDFAVWQLATYMFLHGGLGHLLFNMLSLWMFGTDLERTWGTRFFTKFYFVTGTGAACVTLLWAVLPLPYAGHVYDTLTIGASGAILGLLAGYAMYFPHRTIVFLVFPLSARVAVMIIAAINLYYAALEGGGGVAVTTHLGGLLVGYVYLKSLRTSPLGELKYRWLRWKMNRARAKFDVYSGGRRNDDDDSWKSDWKKHIH